METISIEYKEPFSLQVIETALSQHWRVELAPAETLTVHDGHNRAYVHADTKTGREKGHRLLVDYSDVSFAKKLIGVIADSPTVVVDNDFGTILPGDQFVARCRADQQWNWRE